MNIYSLDEYRKKRDKRLLEEEINATAQTPNEAGSVPRLKQLVTKWFDTYSKIA